MSADHDNAPEGVAIVGLAGCFPGADDVPTLWSNLVDGVDSIRHFERDELAPCIPDETADGPNYVRARGILNAPGAFDASFFRLSPLDARVMDPQHRVFAQVAWAGLEDAGCVPSTVEGLVGVYAGVGPNTYFAHHVSPRPGLMKRVGSFPAMLLNDKDFLATRVSYAFDLKGPSMTLGTACSTSLAAVCQAQLHLLTYQCDVAIAGGVSIVTPQAMGYTWKEGGIFSKQGRCAPFNVDSDGIVSGSGAGVVVLKRVEDALRDGDRIYAVIRGAGVNNDGSAKVGFTAPSVEGQVAAAEMALAQADVAGSSVGFIECHGTGTHLGDPIEVEAMRQVYGESPENSCALGSVKSNIGHLDAASGVASLIKAALALHHKTIPSTLHFKSPNPQLHLGSSRFFVNSDAVEFQRGDSPLRASVNSLGLGGTNAHVVLEEAPDLGQTVDSRDAVKPGHEILLLSAKSAKALDRACVQLAEQLENKSTPPLGDVAHTLMHRRTHFPYRGFVIGTDTESAGTSLRRLKSRTESTSGQPEVVFVFPGQGVQYPGMGAELYQSESVFRENVDRCCSALHAHLGFDLRTLLFPTGSDHADAAERLRQTSITQPAVFVHEYALAQLWISWGVAPMAMLGYSIGEITAACIGGTFDLETALRLIAERGRLIQDLPAGSMLSVGAPASDVAPMLPEDVEVAAYNGPKMCVLCGPAAALESFSEELTTQKITNKLLQTSHAFHSKMMQPAVAQFERVVADVPRTKSSIPIVSTATGTWLTDTQAVDSQHWANHLRQPILFAQALDCIWRQDGRVLLEVGPRNTMTALAKRNLKTAGQHLIVPSQGAGAAGEMATLLKALGQIWQYGQPVQWSKLRDTERGSVVSLPSYPFEASRHWISALRSDYGDGNDGADDIDDADDDGGVSGASSATLNAAQVRVTSSSNAGLPHIPRAQAEQFPEEERYLLKVWHDLLGADHATLDDDFFDLGGHSLVGIELLERVHNRFGADFALGALLEHPTIRAMSEQIRLHRASANSSDVTVTPDAAQQVRGHASWSPLSPLSPEGTLPPLYCVAGLGGNVLELRLLGRYLGKNQPFYGLATRGVAGHTPHTDLESIAIEHIAAIKEHQPEGPYHLAGYSAGGVIAFEMAKRLREAGDEVAFVGLIDSDSPDLPLRPRTKMRQIQLKRLLRSPTDYAVGMHERWQRRMSPTPQPDVTAATEHVVANYRATPYAGDVVLFRTYKDDYIGDIRWVVDSHNGWRALITGRLHVVPVSGTHLTVCQVDAHARVLGAAMRLALQALHTRS